MTARNCKCCIIHISLRPVLCLKCLANNIIVSWWKWMRVCIIITRNYTVMLIHNKELQFFGHNPHRLVIKTKFKKYRSIQYQTMKRLANCDKLKIIYFGLHKYLLINTRPKRKCTSLVHNKTECIIEDVQIITAWKTAAYKLLLFLGKPSKTS